MLICLWTLKAGSGCSVTTALVGLASAARTPCTLVDPHGDLAAVLGIADPAGAGVADWIEAGDGAPPHGLAAAAAQVTDGLQLVGPGTGEVSRRELSPAQLGALEATDDTVLVDAGCVTRTDHHGAIARQLAASATRSVLVTRPCYLALRRIADAPVVPSAIVLLSEPGRALRRRDVEQAVGAPVVATAGRRPGHRPRGRRRPSGGAAAPRRRASTGRRGMSLLGRTEPVPAGVDDGIASPDPRARMHRGDHGLVDGWYPDPGTGEPAGDGRNDSRHDPATWSELCARAHAQALTLPIEALGADHVVRSVETIIDQLAPMATDAHRAQVVADVVDRLRGLGPIEPLLALAGVSDIMVNGPGRVWIERHGRLLATEVEVDAATLDHLVERIVAPLGRRLDRTSPLVDARLPDGSRVHVAAPPIAVDGPILTIRRFQVTDVDLEDMTTPGVAALLRWAVRTRRSVVVAGGTSAGKTTLLNSLAHEIGVDERLVTIEDSAELRLGAGHVVRLEARPASVDGPAAVTIRELVRNALRMRPDRVIVGEVRGPEALDMLQAMNTGHEGSLSTVHANSPTDALRRLETMALGGDAALPLAAIRAQVVAAVDLVVQVERSRDGHRRIVAIAEPARADDPVAVPLADHRGLRSLPRRRPRRRDAPAPDPAWIEVSS